MEKQHLFAKGLLAAIGFIVLLFLCVYSCWAEWGPYAWAAGLEVMLTDSYSVSHATLFWCVAVVVLGVLLSFPIVAGGRSIQLFAYGVPAVLILVHLAVTVYFVWTGGSSLGRTTMANAVQHAGFLPQNLSSDASMLLMLKFEHIAGERTVKSPPDSKHERTDVYIPFDKSLWPDASTPVVLKATSYQWSSPPDFTKFEGTVRKAPIPYLIRSSWGESSYQYAIVITEGGSVREFWAGWAMLYGILFIAVIWSHTSSWFAARKKLRNASKPV